MKPRLARWALLLAAGRLTLAPGALCAAAPVFEKDIRPILKAHCFDCHGEGDELKGGLDLRLRRLMLQGGKEGPVIVPGDPDRSLLYQRVHSGEMPKRDKKLTGDEVELIRKWVAGGATTARPEPEPSQLGKGSGITEEERAFWSFQPIQNPPVPPTQPRDRARTP
ncbi:MAG TPA: c-type cytochrome domain-containing protein, partial [Verrucomicrobiae bacterium]|nr:c-type cytochrome domain-containing protein [Verrucomicrobiae bacterium]